MFGFLVVIAVLISWFVTGVANHYLYPRIMGSVCRPQRDFLVLLGPVGLIMLVLFFLLDRFLKVTACISDSLNRG